MWASPQEHEVLAGRTFTQFLGLGGEAEQQPDEPLTSTQGTDLGRPGPLTEQAHMADFHFPQRRIFAVGRVFVTNLAEEAAQIGR